MRISKFVRMLAIFTSTMAISAVAAVSQGVIVPGPCERCPRPLPQQTLPHSLPVKSIAIDTRISSQVASTHVEQIFENPTNSVMEGTFFFPIPDGASITEFAIWDGSRRLVGEVRSREEARQIYDAIVRRQRDPGLLEYAGKDLFQASIFPIPAHGDKKLELTYTQVLKAESGTVGYKYPLGTGHNFVQIGSVSGKVRIEGQQPVRNIYSPSHAIDTKREGDNRALVTFESRNDGAQKDLQLFYTLSKEDFGMSLLTHREPGKDGYFLLTISPKDDFDEREYSAKDIVFVIDTSGSMAEEGKMDKARAALLFGVRTLRSEDRFNVVSFSGEEHLMSRGLIAADDAGRTRGENFIKQLRPSGGTNINEAAVAAERQFDASDRPRMIVFITDGLPTVGETNMDRILGSVRNSRTSGVRLFSFGVGYDVNTALLDKLANENGGVAQYVEPKEDLEQKVSAFFEKVSFPVLTNVKLDMGGVDSDLVYPRDLQEQRPGRPQRFASLFGKTTGLSGLACSTRTEGWLKNELQLSWVLMGYLFLRQPCVSGRQRRKRLSAEALGEQARWLVDGANSHERRTKGIARRSRRPWNQVRNRYAVYFVSCGGSKHDNGAARYGNIRYGDW